MGQEPAAQELPVLETKKTQWFPELPSQILLLSLKPA